MECKKALVEADGDLDKAVDVLRKMGLAKAVKRAGRETNEGTIAVYVSDDAKVAAMVELTCETDFVGTNGKFKDYAHAVAEVVAKNDPADVDALKACAMGEGTVESELTEMIHVIGENMKINRFARLTADNGAIGCYIHHDGKHADMVSFSFSKPGTRSCRRVQDLRTRRCHAGRCCNLSPLCVRMFPGRHRPRDRHLQGAGSQVWQA